jgi:1L-myo-inositol 1-phosphate cytidylyltransferase
MTVVLLAAGYGARLSERLLGFPKPLVPILGKPLLAHVLDRVFSIRPSRIVVVTGYWHIEIERFLKAFPVKTVHNCEYWRENGVSLLRARPFVHKKFILAMADHLVEPALYRAAAECTSFGLCIDRTPSLTCQQNDATRVWVEKDSVHKIGKDLSEWNALDTGVFSLTPEVFDVLQELSAQESCTITEGVRALIARGHTIRALDVSGKFWADIDTIEDLKEIERLLRL